MNYPTLYRSANVFFQLLYAKFFRKRIPVRIALQLTKTCNMRCSYCYANFNTYKNVQDPTREEYFKLIDELYSLGTRWLWFLGGEPMLYRDFEAVVDYAHSKGMFCDMNSNGVAINEKNIHIAKKLDGVCISLDGDEESNDFYRGKGSFQKAVKAIKLLRLHGVKVRLHAILTKKTQDKLEEMVDLANELGCFFNYCEVIRNTYEDDHLLSDEESQKFYEKYLEFKKNGAPIMHSVQTIKYIMNWPKKENNRIYKYERQKYPRKSFVKCLSGDLLCFLDLDGKIYSCNGTWEEGLNYREVGFKKAWDYLQNRKCISCRCIGLTELHLLMGLSFKNFLNGIKNVLLLNR